MEGALVVAMWGSLLIRKPLLVVLAEQQGQTFPPVVKQRMAGMTFRVGLFFLIQTGLAVWSALYWSTTAWALLKGVGLTVSFIVYLVLEALYMRRQVQKMGPGTPPP
jgi:intracellular septation protein